MTQAIVIDKCFLQGSSATQVYEMALRHRLLVSDALFYELLTTDGPTLTRCFRKFPRTNSPVDLISHIGTLMRYEINNHEPAGKPSRHKENIGFDFQFNQQLSCGDYVLPEEYKVVVADHTAELVRDVASYLDRANVISEFFPDLLIGSDQARQEARIEAEKLIAMPGSLKVFYAGLKSPPGERPLPSVDLVDESWALYKYLQVQLLFAIDIYVRHAGIIPTGATGKAFEKLEHDVLDAQLVALGVLEGAFASREGKLKRWFKLLCPMGSLYE